MNRRITLLTIVAIITMAILGQVALAQDNNVPQALVNTEQVILRDTPSQSGAYTGTLTQNTQVSLVGGEGNWLQVATEDGVEGWSRANQFTSLDRARTIRTLLIFEAPDDNINYVAQLEEGTPVLVLQTDETNKWARVMTAGNTTGWTEKSLLRYDFGLSQEADIPVYSWINDITNETVAVLEAGQPVRIKDSTDGWVHIQTTDNIEGWAEASKFHLVEDTVQGYIELENSEMANLRVQPIIDAQSAGTVLNGAEVMVIGRDATNRWLLIATGSDQLAWTSAGLVELLEGQMDSLPVLTQ